MITVFGSLNVDLVTPVERLPGAGETVIGPGYALHPGGKGANQALAARRAGAEVVLAGAVGRDAFAEIALSLLAADGVDLTLVERVEAPTGAAFIAVDAAGSNQIVVAAGANARPGPLACATCRLASVTSCCCSARFRRRSASRRPGWRGRRAGASS